MCLGYSTPVAVVDVLCSVLLCGIFGAEDFSFFFENGRRRAVGMEGGPEGKRWMRTGFVGPRAEASWWLQPLTGCGGEG